MVAFSRNAFSYLLYGTKSCILDFYQGDVADTFEIPDTIDGYIVRGITTRFAASIKNVKSLVLSEHVSNIVTTNRDFKILLETVSWESIQVVDGNKQYTSIDGVLFSKNGKTLILYPPAKEDAQYYIPDCVQTSSTNAFCYNHNLKSLSFGKHFEAINIYTIAYCNSLRSVKIYSPQTTLQDWSFKYCQALEEIRFPDGSNKYEVINNAVYQKINGFKYKLLLFPPALKVKHYVVPADTSSMSSSALEYLSSVSKVHVPKQCDLPFASKNNKNFSFYNPQSSGTDAYIRKPMETYNGIESKEEIENKPQRSSFLERMLSRNAEQGFLSIPNYKNYKELESAVEEVVLPRVSKLLDSIKSIILPKDMESVDHSFFTKFPNLAEIKCDGKGAIHVEDNVLYNGDAIIFYPPCSRTETLSIKKDCIRVGNKAFYNNKHLVNFILDCPLISFGRNVFDHALKIQNVVLVGNVSSFGKNIFIKSKSSISVFAFGSIKSCAPNAFGGVSGIAKLFVLTITERNHLVTTLGGSNCAVTMITKQRMVELLEILSKKYKISMPFLPKQLFSTTKESVPKGKAEKLPRNVRVEIKVAGHKFTCINRNHHLVTKRVSLDMIDTKHNYRTVDIDVGYCVECKNYFVYSNVFRAIQDKMEYSGWKLIGVSFYIPGGKSYGYVLESFGELRKESILKICGYSVGASSNLTSGQRMDILTGIIKRNWLTKQGVMSYLNWFIDFHGHNPSMQWAVKDWRSDLKTLNSMRL